VNPAAQIAQPMTGPSQRDALPEKDDTRVGHFVQLHGRRVKEASTRSDRAGK